MRSPEREPGPVRRAAGSSAEAERIGLGPLIALVGAGLITAAGLTGDLVRHVLHPPPVPEGVLGGWHPVLWAGAGLCVIVTVVGVTAAGLGGIPERVRLLGPAVVGSVLASGAAPLLLFWHRRIGSQTRLDALLSPPHLVAFTGTVLVLVTPIVVLTRPSDGPGGEPPVGYGRSLLVWMPMIAVLVMTNLLTGYTSALLDGVAFDLGPVAPIIGRSRFDAETIRAVSSMVWFTATVTIAHAVLLGRFRPRPGVILGGFVLVGLAPIVIGGVEDGRALAAGLLAAGVVLEVMRILDAGARSRFVRSAGLVLATVTLWSVFFLVLDLRRELIWSLSTTTGSILLTAIVAGLLAAVCSMPIGPRRPEVPGRVAVPERGPRGGSGRRDRNRPARPVDRLLAEFDDDDIFTPSRTRPRIEP